MKHIQLDNAILNIAAHVCEMLLTIEYLHNIFYHVYCNIPLVICILLILIGIFIIQPGLTVIKMSHILDQEHV